MKSKLSSTVMLLLTAFICLFAYLNTFGQNFKKSSIPSEIQFNGTLTDKDGKILPDNTYNFTFYLYDSQETKTPLWKEQHNNISVKEGQFQVDILKSIENSPLVFPLNKKYYVGMQINNDEEMPQRIEFGIVPYSLGAKFADKVSDNSITTEKLANNSVTNDKIKSISINKITNLPNSLNSVESIKNTYGITGSDYEWWTTFGNIIFGPERHFLGTRNDRNFEIVTHEIQRMLFDPHGYIVLGTVANPVDFEVYGLTTLDYLYVTGNLGVGVDPANAKMHIDAPLHKLPFRIDYQTNQIFGIDTTGRVSINSTVGGGDSDLENYPLKVSGGDHGVGIKIDGSSTGDMNYVSFWDSVGMVGRIEGQTPGEYAAQPLSIATDVYFAALASAEIYAAVAFLYPLPIPTEPADIIRVAADMAEITFNTIWDLAHTGITYESGSGDYAEWLECENREEILSPGDIVAVNGGKISKNTSIAEQFMAISTSPIILGNMPTKGKEEFSKKVAFMGQIPVKVRGVVNIGDYIIPSGLNDGTGIAVSPNFMTLDEYSKIVGRAWSSSFDEAVKPINVLVGISSSDIGKLLHKLEKEEGERTLLDLKSMHDVSNLSKATQSLETRFKNFEKQITVSKKNYIKID